MTTGDLMHALEANKQMTDWLIIATTQADGTMRYMVSRWIDRLDVSAQREEVEVTRNGMLGGDADMFRRFIPGPARFDVQVRTSDMAYTDSLEQALEMLDGADSA